MYKKKKRILILFQILCVQVKLLNGEDLTEKNKNNDEDENIFVFPSMQMEGIAAASSRGGKHVPVVEVIYRGQPPSPEDQSIKSTTISSSEVISSARTPRGKSFMQFY